MLLEMASAQQEKKDKLTHKYTKTETHYLGPQLTTYKNYQQKVLAFHLEQLQQPLSLQKSSKFLAQAAVRDI